MVSTERKRITNLMTKDDSKTFLKQLHLLSSSETKIANDLQDHYQCGTKTENCAISKSLLLFSIYLFFSQRKLMIEEHTGKRIRFE